jgi:hypothetical protein
MQPKVPADPSVHLAIDLLKVWDFARKTQR